MPHQVGMRSEYALLFEALRNREIRFCLLRDDLQGPTQPRDLDLLVHDDRFKDALRALEEIGYRVKVSERYLPFKTVLVKYADGHFIVLDLHRRLVQAGIVYMDHRSVLSRVQPVEDYFLPADSDLLAILVFHNIIGKRRIQEKHYSKIRELSERVEHETLRASLGEYGTYPLLAQVIDELEAYYQEPARVERAREQIVEQLRRVDPGSRRRMFALRLRRWLRRYDPRRRAPIYALVGVDGTGKSTLSAALADHLNQQHVFSAVVQYMGPWGQRRLKFVPGSPYVPGYSLTPREWLAAMWRREGSPRVRLGDTLRLSLKAMVGRKLSKDEKALHQEMREHSRLYLTLRMVRSQLRVGAFFTFLMADMYYRYWRAYRHRRRGTIVIADRYIYDVMTGQMRRSVTEYRRMRRLMCRLFFHPTRVFLLTADPATILARKKDLTPDTLRDFQAVYEDLAAKYSFEVVQSDQPPDILAQKLVERHFDELLARLRA